jgi:DNA-binding transcriptional regulator LsrR (DeoR family)
MTSRDRLRLMTRIARLYHEQGIRQPEIAAQLNLSQPMVSRLLRAAQREGIVRTTVAVPRGVYPELEESLERMYGLREAIVADSLGDSDDDILRDLGSAAALYLETTLASGGETVGISSWSETLLRMVTSMQPLSRARGSRVVQILGGIGNPAAEVHATRLTERLAFLLKGEALFLPAPGVTGTAEATAAFLSDPFVARTVACFDELTVALVGIGALHPSRLLAQSGNIFSEAELEALEHLGVVGDICLRFFDAEGIPVQSGFDDRVIAATFEQLRRVPRSVGIAGGPAKLDAIRGALAGGWINVLITDRFTAERLTAVGSEISQAVGGMRSVSQKWR